MKYNKTVDKEKQLKVVKILTTLSMQYFRFITNKYREKKKTGKQKTGEMWKTDPTN